MPKTLAPVEVPEPGRHYRAASGLTCRIVDLVTPEPGGDAVVVFWTHTRGKARTMSLARFIKPVRWADGVLRQRFMPTAHLPPEMREADR